MTTQGLDWVNGEVIYDYARSEWYVNQDGDLTPLSMVDRDQWTFFKRFLPDDMMHDLSDDPEQLKSVVTEAHAKFESILGPQQGEGPLGSYNVNNMLYGVPAGMTAASMAAAAPAAAPAAAGAAPAAADALPPKPEWWTPAVDAQQGQYPPLNEATGIFDWWKYDQAEKFAKVMYPALFVPKKAGHESTPEKVIANLAPDQKGLWEAAYNPATNTYYAKPKSVTSTNPLEFRTMDEGVEHAKLLTATWGKPYAATTTSSGKIIVEEVKPSTSATITSRNQHITSVLINEGREAAIAMDEFYDSLEAEPFVTPTLSLNDRLEIAKFAAQTTNSFEDFSSLFGELTGNGATAHKELVDNRHEEIGRILQQGNVAPPAADSTTFPVAGEPEEGELADTQAFTRTIGGPPPIPIKHAESFDPAGFGSASLKSFGDLGVTAADGTKYGFGDFHRGDAPESVRAYLKGSEEQGGAPGVRDLSRVSRAAMQDAFNVPKKPVDTFAVNIFNAAQEARKTDVTAAVDLENQRLLAEAKRQRGATYN
jgi:hypothetical protein